MTSPTEVDYTTRSSSRFITVIVALSVVGTIVGTGFAIASTTEWLVMALWAIGALVMIGILLAIGYSVGDAARATEALRRAGTLTSADVIDAKIEDWHDDGIVSELTLRIRPVGGEEFTVTHRCSRHHCRETAKAAPTTISALVDESTRTWAVIH